MAEENRAELEHVQSIRSSVAQQLEGCGERPAANSVARSADGSQDSAH